MLWTLKSLINGPKRSKMAPNSPPKPPTNTVWLYSVPQYMFWGHLCLYGPKKIDSKLAKIDPIPSASIGALKCRGNFWATFFQLLPTYIYIGEGIFAKKICHNIPSVPDTVSPPLLILHASAFRRKLRFKIVPLIPDLTVNCSGLRTPVLGQDHWSCFCELFFS